MPASAASRLALAAALTGGLSSAAVAERVIAPGEWELLSIPGDASATTWRALFVDRHALAETDYLGGTPMSEAGWALYLFDSDAGGYRAPGLDDAPVPGEGFWFIHLGTDPLTLDLPESVGPAVGSVADGCASRTCTSIELGVDDVGSRYTLAGVPAPGATGVADLRFVTSGAECDAGCDLAAAGALGYTFPGAYVYDPRARGGRGDYVLLENGDPLDEWSGFWSATGPELAATAPRLRVPVPGEPEPDGPGALVGRVTDPVGRPLENVRVLQDSALGAVTDADGRWRIEDAAGEHRLSIAPPGFTPQQARVDVPAGAGEARADFVVAPRSVSTTFRIGGQVQAFGRDGAGAFFDAVALSGSDGQGTAGAAGLALTSIDPRSAALREVLPGALVADGQGALLPLGATELFFARPNGEPLSYDAGQPFTLRVPLYAAETQEGAVLEDTDLVPLYRFDPARDVWLQGPFANVETFDAGPGDRSVTGVGDLVAEAVVSEPGWWMAALPLESAALELELRGVPAGTVASLSSSTPARATLGWHLDPGDRLLGAAPATIAVPGGETVCIVADLSLPDGGRDAVGPACTAVDIDARATLVLDAGDVGAAPRIVVDSRSETNDVVEALAGNVRTRIALLASNAPVALEFDASGLPDGMRVQAVDDARAEIVGAPARVGTYPVIVSARGEGVSADTSLEIVVAEDLPVRLADPIDLEFDLGSGLLLLDVGVASQAGTVTEWRLLEEPGPQRLDGLSLDPATGILRLDEAAAANGATFYYAGGLLGRSDTSEQRVDLIVSAQ